MSKSDEIEDFLTEDSEISSQKVVLLSFLSPEKVLAKKDLYFFRECMKDYEFQWKTSKFDQWFAERIHGINEKLEKLAGSLELKDLSGVSHEIRSQEIRVDRLIEEFEDYKRKNKKELTQTNIQSEYDDFMFKNQTKLEEDFFAKNEFRTSIRGLKVRGVTGTHGEAVAMSKKLQRSDTIHNIFLGEVGKWLPWDPKPHQVADQEYAEDQLNTLMKRYKDNEEARDKFVSEQRQELSKGARKGPVIAASDGNPISGESSEGWGSMFGGSADLAMERKVGVQEKVNVPEDTFEKLA